ncbi:MAG: hypothetical protein WCT10_00990 [Patescibacteria group bacterium]|jgi:hypothetical protein
MNPNRYLKFALSITLAGTMFSGYLAGTRFFSGVCAFREGCPVFLGFPACYFGFALFSTMFVSTAYAWAFGVRAKWPVAVNTLIASLGVMFAGSFTVGEIATWFTSGFRAFGRLGLSTCAYGLVFFIIILVVSLSVRFESAASGRMTRSDI